ncbi:MULTISPECIES: hypothetical protein [Streptomyces]|uniref:hypothetical protein n=1 Tax=Streptomyces TaxID=1883 RepID=UPI000BF1836F|nr:hypothetical protein [Streptomyces sp. gb14]
MARNGNNRRELDKWAKSVIRDANKSLERAARRNPARTPLQINASPAGGGALDSGEAIENNPHLARLLMWLEDYAQQHPAHYVSVTRFVDEHDLTEDASVLAFQLEQRGLVNIARSFGGTPDVHLTDEGHVAAHRLKNLQTNRAARLRYTLDAFLNWMFTTGQEQAPLDLTDFLDAPAAYFAGDALTPVEAEYALSRLLEHKLLERPDAAPETIALTTEGTNCILSGASVSDHISRPAPGGNVTFHIGENTGNIAANSRDFTMNAATMKDGIDPAAVVMLARALRQAAPILDLPEDEATEFTELATRIEQEAMGGSPDPGRLRRWGASVTGILNSPVVSGALGSVLAAYTGTVLPGLPGS